MVHTTILSSKTTHEKKIMDLLAGIILLLFTGLLFFSYAFPSVSPHTIQFSNVNESVLISSK